ncbi:MAG TPA: hypothetical protein VF145_05180 [Chitinophagaceae bacterium]
MKKILAGLAMLCSLQSFSQSSATEDRGQVVFEKSKSAISYNGFSVEYLFPSYSMNSVAFSSSGLALSYEAYKPLGKRTAVSANISAVLLDELTNLELNVGFYFLPYKGIYLKPQIGFGQYGFNDEYLKEYIPKGNFTYRAQAGYLFALNKEGKRPKFIDLGFAYHTATNSVLTTNYFGISLKYLWGPKP